MIKSKLRLLGAIFLIAGIAVIGINAFEQSVPTIDIPEIADLGLYESERQDGGYFTIVNEEGEVLDKTVRHVYIGDELIVSDNRHYRVVEIDGDTAVAELIGTREINQNSNWGTVDIPVSGDVAVQGEAENATIAIYHTHTAESYVPTEGEPFVEAEGEAAQGGIVNVGEMLATKLEELGFNVVLDTTPHEPHDANAYYRSRRTAAQLLKEQPVLMIDVHRDAVPDPDFYTAQVDSDQVSRIRLVVGRQNQNMQANLEFAEQMKAAIDEKFPDLMHAIFMAKGNYNQDLGAKAILIEVGTHVTSREDAEKGVALFAEAIPTVLGITPGGGGGAGAGDRAPTTEGEGSSIAWIIGLSLLAGGAFLLISTGSLSGARDKFKQFVGEEWANFMGKMKHRKANVYQSSLNRKAFKLEENKDAEKQPDNKDNKSDE
ncbi:MAG: stage II sporulation protein P [Bacillota bacterium]|nr:stage II sporulation protein P [Bacillota bacterium]